MEDEGVLFEGLRLGSVQAFEELLRGEDATMRRLARLYVPEDLVGPLLARTWSVALPGLDMFTWHTTLRAWLTGILVTYGRAWSVGDGGGGAAGTGAGGPGGTVPAPRRTGTDDGVPWSSLGWSGLWGPDGWDALEAALAARPQREQEVLWLHDVEGWPWREVLDTLGLTADQGGGLLAEGRAALADVVAAHVGGTPGGTPGSTAGGTAGDGAGRGAREAGVAALLGALRPRAAGAPPDRGLVRMFAAWRRHRRVRVWRRWRWDLDRVRSRRRPRSPGPRPRVRAAG